MRKLPINLYDRAMAIFSDLCQWCGKKGSEDCDKCQIREAAEVVELHKP